MVEMRVKRYENGVMFRRITHVPCFPVYRLIAGGDLNNRWRYYKLIEYYVCSLHIIDFQQNESPRY